MNAYWKNPIEHLHDQPFAKENMMNFAIKQSECHFEFCRCCMRIKFCDKIAHAITVAYDKCKKRYIEYNFYRPTFSID